MLVVLEPGRTPATARLPTVPVMIELAPGRSTRVDIETSESAAAETVDLLYRVGGRELVDQVEDETARTALGPACARQIAVNRRLALDALIQIDEVALAVLKDQLDMARGTLRLSRYGLAEVAGKLAKPPVANSDEARDRYRGLRAAVAGLDAMRRGLRMWNFTVPDNAPHARAQYESQLGPYVAAFRAATEQWPALAVCGGELLTALGKRRGSSVRAWAQADDGTPLDDLIKDALAETWTDLLDKQPGFLRDQRTGSAKAIRTAELLVGIGGRPEKVFGTTHPLWRHPFLVHTALQRLDLRPGDIGHAAAVSALRYAEEDAAAGRAAKARDDAVLGWASIGFGVLSLIPVIGQFALAAALVVTAVRAFSETVEYVDEQARRQAVGPLADRFGFAEPDAAGLVVTLLDLASSVALPVLGKAIGQVLRPAGRLVAAARVQSALQLGEHAADLAGVVVDMNSALLEKELLRLGLDKVERGGSP
ncbi:hypothetical protein [Sphaerisporangium aureirubrum]|uniref:Uncharacterized protein n=1 Tax=Sphaerisporangium aureirubrum TaxID=1544736 RepID=A0ABW1NT26_9ACTN